jgi:hypothetical protein
MLGRRTRVIAQITDDSDASVERLQRVIDERTTGFG